MSQKKFAAFDIDGTLYRSGLYREVVFELLRMKILPEEFVTELNDKMRIWRHRLHGSAFEEFELFLTSYLDEHLPKLKVADYETAVERVLAAKGDDVYAYTRDLARDLRSQGYFLIAISGSQQELVEPFAKKNNFDAWIGQHWERDGDHFTGNITKTHTGKDKILKALIEEHDLTLDGSYAVGDSNGDVGMLEMVDHPITFNPTHELLEKALARKWRVVIERKNVIYELGNNDDTYVLAKTRHL